MTTSLWIGSHFMYCNKMQTSCQRSSPLAASLNLQQENGRLQRKLVKCKADKDFVWSLWKQLQTDSPDVTQMVDLIVTREKEKLTQREFQFHTVLQAKNSEISELTEACREVQSTLEEAREEIEGERKERLLLQSMAEQQENTNRERSAELESLRAELERKDSRGAGDKGRQTSEQLKSLQAFMKEMTEQLNTVTRENSQNSVKAKNLDVDLVAKSDQLRQAHQSLRRRGREVRRLRETVRALQDHSPPAASEAGRDEAESQDARIHFLEAELRGKGAVLQEKEAELQGKEAELRTCGEHYRKQISGFEEQLKTLQDGALKVGASVHVPPSPCLRVGAWPGEEGLRETLERTEAELFAASTSLKTKEQEVAELRAVHDRRLLRMRALQEQNKALQEGRSPVPRPPSSAPLRQEDSREVWNDLHYYKKLCQQLNTKIVELNEECDVLRACSVQDRAKLQQVLMEGEDKCEELFEKFSAIADLELEGTQGSSDPRAGDRTARPAPPPATPTSHYSRMVLKLQKEKADLQRQCRDGGQQCADLRCQLEALRRDLQHEKRRTALRARRTTSDQSTATDHRPPTSRSVGTSPISFPAPPAASDGCMQTPVAHGYGDKQNGRLSTTSASTQTTTSASTQTSPRVSTDGDGRGEGAGQGAGQGAGLCTCRQHQCVEDRLRTVEVATELKAAQASGRSRERQLTSLQSEKKAVEKSLAKECRGTAELGREICSLKEQLATSKASVEGLSVEAQQLRRSCGEAQALAGTLRSSLEREGREGRERAASQRAGRRRLEGRVAALQEAGREGQRALRGLEAELRGRIEQGTALEGRVTLLEQDLKSKKSLVEALRRKERERAAFLDQCQGKINALSAEVEGLSTSNDQYRARYQGLKDKLNKEASEKSTLSTALQGSREDLTSTSQEVSRLLSQLKSQQSSLQKKTVQTGQAQEGLRLAEQSCQRLETEVQEHRRFTKALLSQLCSCLAQRRKRAGPGAEEEGEELTSRARQLAKTALNLSDRELKEFLQETTSAQDVDFLTNELDRVWTSAESRGSTLCQEMLQLFSPLTLVLQS